MDELWQTLWHALKDPFRYPVDGAERIFWLYLLSSLILAVGVYFYLRRHRPETIPANPFSFLFPKKVYLHKSAIADYQFFLIDRIVFALMLPVVLVFTGPVAGLTQTQLTRVFGVMSEPLDGLWVALLFTGSQILLNDFLLFYMHYIFHKIPVLWEFHKVHHSAEVMTPLTAYRMHPFEVVFNMNVTALFTGMLWGFFAWMAASNAPPGFTAFEVNIVQVAFYLIGFNLRHSHVPLGYGAFSKVFVSPWMHQIHHSRETRHLDKNMGFIFSFWDAMFGTLYVPKRNEPDYALGLTTGEHVHFHNVAAMYFRPFANLARRWLKPAKTA